MSDETESGKGGLITDAAKAVAAITENVPIYQDAVQPAAKELGKGLHLVAKAVNVALIPVEGLVWGVDSNCKCTTESFGKDLSRSPVAETFTRPVV